MSGNWTQAVDAMVAATETKQAILESTQEAARSRGGIRGYGYYLELPLLQHSEESPMLCRETPAAFEAVNSSFWATIPALFHALNDFEKLSKTHDDDKFIRKEGLELDLHVVNQSFASSRESIRRVFHSGRLSQREPTALP
ncbi:hypothetical protein KJ359_003868 [Pestalotiopsis sp. 9143b]|nr:hypothetical protein KJ359_003868 [Pestalotiopsis sp. 9143b]